MSELLIQGALPAWMVLILGVTLNVGTARFVTRVAKNGMRARR